MSDHPEKSLVEALDALVLADRLLSERDNVQGPDASDAQSFYTDEYLEDWRTIRAAIVSSSHALGREHEFPEEASAPRM